MIRRRRVFALDLPAVVKKDRDSEHIAAWTTAGSVVAGVGLTATIGMLRESNPSVPLLSVCIAVALVGCYWMLAPLLRWWPWSPSLVRPLVLVAVIALAITGVSLGHGPTVHARSRKSAVGSTESGRIVPAEPAHITTRTQRALTSAGLVLHRGRRFAIGIPAGWLIVKSEILTPSREIESTWWNPAHPHDTLLVDLSLATGLQPEEDAAPVRQALAKATGYEEMLYGPESLGGVAAWAWMFRLSGNQFIDYFFTRCSTSFAVLGSTLIARFGALQSTFRAVAESVTPGCTA